MSDIEKFPLKSMNITEDQKQKFKQLFPEVFTEGEKIDWDKLRLTLGENVDVGKERFSMNWPGKADCFKIIQQPSLATLVPARDESVNFDTTENLFIEGDNLEVLKLLQKSYLGKIKMIYIDPPYNTGNDFIYPDNYSETLETYLAYTGQVDSEGRKFSTNTDTEGRYHSRWMNMMYPRLFLAKNLLKENGVIFISIDDNEVDNLKKICNEIFGEENFKGGIVRATGTTTGQDAKKIGSSFDYCLCYSKNPELKLKGLPLLGKDLNRFSNDDNDGKGKYALLQLRKTGNADRKEDREKMFFGITAPDGSPVYPIGPTGYLSRWRVGPKTYNEFLKNNLLVWKQINDDEIEDEDDLDEEEEGMDEINDAGDKDELNLTEDEIEKYKSNWKPYVKYYLAGRTKQVSNLWTDIDGNKKGSIELRELFAKKKIFDNPKPTAFIRRLTQISTHANDIVLDFFAGSCSTSHSILEINKVEGVTRRFICIQLPELTPEKSGAFKSGFKNIADLGKERIRRVIKKIEEEQKQNSDMFTEDKPKPDLGFKVFKLSPSNFSTWNANVDKTAEAIGKQLELHVDHISESANQEAILYELLLKSGFELTTKIEKLEIEGKSVFSIGEGELLICLERKLTNDLIKAMAERKPARVICLDEGFQNTDQLKTNAALIMKTKGVVKFQTV